MEETSHRFLQSGRSRRREKAHGAGGGVIRRTMMGLDSKSNGYDLGSMDRAHGEGYDQLKGQRNALTMATDSTCGSVSRREENSFTLDWKQNSYRKVSGRPIKAIKNEEMFKETDIRRTSPSVIARLMGLDELPPPKVVHKQQKETGSRFWKTLHAGSQEKHAPYRDRSLQTKTPDLQGVKDVFEVMEASKVMKGKDELVHKAVPRMKHETDVTFDKQKITNAKFLATGETQRRSKGFDDALENLDPSRDRFVKYLQEPNSLLTKHLHDLECFPASSYASHITSLKSSDSTKHEIGEVCCKSKRAAEGCTNMKKDFTCSSGKPTTGLLSHSLKDFSSSHSHNLSRIQYVGKNDTCSHPSQIVVLKPSLEKAWNVGKTVSLPRAPENFQFAYQRHRQFGRPGFWESYREGRVWHNFFDNIDALEPKKKSSREFARGITKEMRQSGSSDAKKAFNLRFNGHIRDKRPAMSNQHNFAAVRRSSDRLDGWNNSYDTSSTYSTKYSVSREARKHLSDRCKLIKRFKEVEHVGRDMNTLEEMLALSDEERQMAILGLQSIHKVSDEKLVKSEVLETWGCPSGISSGDGWKDGYFINLPRSSSLSGSSKVHGPPNPCIKRDQSGGGDCYIPNDVLGPNASLHGKLNLNGSSLCRYAKYDRKSRFLSSSGEEKLWEIHVNPDDMKKKAHVKVPAEVQPKVLDFSDDTKADAGAKILTDYVSVPQNMDTKIPSSSSVQQQTRNILLRKDGDFAGNDQNILAMEETSSGHPQVDCCPIRTDETEAGSSVSSKEVEQPSPVSVLEPLSKSSLGCADLKERQMQLEFLQLESVDAYEEGSELLVTGDEDMKRDCHSFQLIGDIMQEFRDEEERDFSYLLDILIDAGVHAAKQDKLYHSCYSPEFPVGPDVFENLEKRYNKLVTWSKSERKLFFDLINSILAEILAPCMDLHPWVQSNRKIGPMWGCEGLVEKAWQMSVKQRKELNVGNPEEKVLDFKWFELGDDIDIIGREIERMLKEDLVEELVSEFVLGSPLEENIFGKYRLPSNDCL